MTCYPDDLVFSEFEKKEKIGEKYDTLPCSVGFFLSSFNTFWPKNLKTKSEKSGKKCDTVPYT